MARPREPWFRKQTQCWYVEIDGKQHNLGPDQEEAQGEFHRLMLNRKKPVTEEHLAVILDNFLSHVQRELPKSYRWYRDYIQSFLDSNPHFLATDLKPHHVLDWANQGAGRRGRITAMKRAMNWAAEMGYIDHSPIDKMKRPAAGKRDRVVPRIELAALLRDVARDFAKLILFVYHTGARPQEAVAAQRKHLNEDRLIFHPNELPKGEKYPRIVYLNKKAMRLVNDDGYLLTNSRGKPWTSNAVRCRFRRQGDGYCLYHFRHTFCHEKLAAGVDSLTVSVLMGHRSPVTTAAVYAHLNQADDHLRAAVE